jgi:hypothetical protein
LLPLQPLRLLRVLTILLELVLVLVLVLFGGRCCSCNVCSFGIIAHTRAAVALVITTAATATAAATLTKPVFSAAGCGH